MANLAAHAALPSAAPVPERGARVRVALLGSTGSIGRQTVDVLTSAGREAVEVVALAAGRAVETLESQVQQLRPKVVSMADPDAAASLSLPPGTRRADGETALLEMATRDDVDLVIVATGGVVSLRPVLAALGAGKIVATANKETLVSAGHLVMPLAQARAESVRSTDPSSALASPLAWLRPIDSEHSAIWQCLAGEDLASVARLILTASGGPFREWPAERMADGHPGRRPRAPQLDDGRQDHHRLGDAHEQGPGGHRGPLALRCALRAHRRRHPPPEPGPFVRRVRGRLA